MNDSAPMRENQAAWDRYSRVNEIMGLKLERDCPEETTGYESLQAVLDNAYRQASQGKGKERHACERPFEEQQSCQITREQGIGYPLGQAQKKIGESRRLDRDAAIRELLGAINYIAMGIIILEEGDENSDDKQDGL